jgi:hypothetical protein
MIRPSSLLAVVMLSLGLFTWGGAQVPRYSLAFDRMDLTDGRRLTKVVVKSYDAEKETVLLVARGEAMVVGIDLVPEPVRSRLKEEAPPAGASTVTVPFDSLHASIPVDTLSSSSSLRLGSGSEAHKAAALERAQTYYRFEYQAGSGAAKVTALNFETDDPEPVDNWTGRYRTQGRVLLEYFDSKGYSFNRATDRFEIITEQKDKGSIKVVDFTRK